MPFTTLIATDALASHLNHPRWAIVDCRFNLTDPAEGQQLYYEAHIPGAVYANLDRHLSGPKTGKNGRHPLPDINQFKMRLGLWGIGPGVQVVAYDQDTGMFASRLWWMLRYLGHEAVAVLDGGFAKWIAEGRPTRAKEENRAPAQFSGSPRETMRVTVNEVDRLRLDPAHLLLDARAPERYRGETEPLDPVAGHIPGALNYFYKNNLNPDGTFLSPDALQSRLQDALGRALPPNTVVYCGSGVTACHNLLALEHAGLPGAKLYVGSWSEWCADPQRSVAREN
jgi:thiosulfate/3-mercaptopyruvate sulfurtransferase